MMRSKYSIVTILTLVTVGILMFAGMAEANVPNATQLSGWAPGPRGLAVTSDGETAYISFSLDDSLLVVDLSTFTTVRSIDVSKAGSMLFSSSAVLSPDESKLYVVNDGTDNVMVIDTKSYSLEKVLPIDPLWGDGISVARDGTVYVASTQGELYIIDGSDNSYNKIFIPGLAFESINPSNNNPDLLYCIGRLFPEGESPQRIFFTFNLSNNSVERTISLANEVLASDATLMCFTINSNETVAYFGARKYSGGSWGEKGVGNFNVFDLNSFEMLVSTPIENGVADFVINEGTSKIYIIGFWSGGGSPQSLSITEWDISTNSVSRKIPVSPSSDQRAIIVDPTDSNYLYMTEGDFSLLRKVEISTGKEIQKLIFNKEDILPYALIRGDNVGYVTCHSSRNIYKLNLTSGQLIGVIPLPDGASHAGGYYQDKLYFSGGRHIYSINPSDGSLIETFNIKRDINPIKLTFFNDKMATISYETMMIGKELLIFDAKNMSLLKAIDLSSEPYGDEVIVSPDGSKLYISRGACMGTAAITIFNASSLDIIKTIEIPFIGVGYRGATSFSASDFDETNRILYLAGFESVYKIDMDTDELIGILDVLDVGGSQNLRGWSPTGLAGVVLSSSKNKLFVIAGDSHSMYTYDFINSSWLTKITNLKGYFPTDSDYSPERKYLYTVNQRSDSITMVNLASGNVEKIIQLTPVPTSPPAQQSTSTLDASPSIDSTSISPTSTSVPSSVTDEKPPTVILISTISTSIIVVVVILIAVIILGTFFLLRRKSRYKTSAKK